MIKTPSRKDISDDIIVSHGKILLKYKSCKKIKPLVKYYMIESNKLNQERFLSVIKALELKINFEIRAWGPVLGVKTCNGTLMLDQLNIRAYSKKDLLEAETVLSLTGLHYEMKW